MPDPAISIRGVSKRFGPTPVLEDLSLDVPGGQTFAFLGRNGAGKTTTIRMLIGLLKPDAGSVRVLELDPARDAIAIRRAVGYLAEDQTMFGWMRVSQIISFFGAFYPTWDDGLARRLIGQFELDPRARVKFLSKGQNVRLGLLLALSHRPQLVILDDPTLGLDPIMRKQLLRDVVGLLQGEGTTVFFSSHLLYEVEPVADQIAILDRGRIIRVASCDELRARVKRVVIPSDRDDLINRLGPLLDVQRADRRTAVVVEDFLSIGEAIASGGADVQVVDLNLDEIFEAYVIGARHESGPAELALEGVA